VGYYDHRTMAAAVVLLEDRVVRAPTFVTAVVALGSALALGAVALGVANAVPNTPPPAYVDHYLEDLRALPPPAESAEIISEATGDTLPAAPQHDDDHHETATTIAGSGHDGSGDDDSDHRRDDRSGRSEDSGHDDRDDRSGRSGGSDDERDDHHDDDRSGSGSGSGRDHPEDS